MIKEASILLDTKEDVLQEFDELDLFNNNRLNGVICRQSDYRYGAMVIFKINSEPCEQIIYCTPKLEYPFDRNGTFHWPDISQIEVWDKLDGSNILAFWYEYRDSKFLSFKTRLSPILKDGRYGSFYSMWMEYLSESKWIYPVCLENPEFNLSFEMFGYRNPITIQYNIPLEVNLLFGIRRKDHAVRPPSQLILPSSTKLPKVIQIEKKSELTELYEELRSGMSTQNDGNLFVEGMVLYAFCNQPSWRQFKCKPNEIQQIHWAHIGIPKRELWNTAINSFENGICSFDNFVELLKEEYTEQQIGKSQIRIAKIFKEAISHIEIVQKVNEVWSRAKEKGFDITKDKGATFKFISQFFEKKDMRKVGSIILGQIGG